MRQIGLLFLLLLLFWVFFFFFLHFKMPPCFHQTHISSSHLKRAVLRGRWEAEAGYSRDQETTFNFKSIPRKTLRRERGSKYHSAFTSSPNHADKRPPLSLLPCSVCPSARSLHESGPLPLRTAASLKQ